MLFNSFDFILFFIVVTTLYFLLPFTMRWLMLLTASCIFYMYFIPKYILILFLTIIIDYVAGIAMDKYPGRKKTFLIMSLIANVGILFFFKYFNFFVDNINSIAQLIHWNYSVEGLKIILPIGLSFHTFQAMSYTIEVYRGQQKAERHLGIYALYVMYYPQLVAGPIERPQNLLHQFHTKHQFDFERMLSGLRLMLWGIFKKVVIADRLAVYVNNVYSDSSSYHAISIFLACVFFSIQIYCDFSGYSDIARGASRIMGIELMKNFNMPYFARNISDFWSRWHMSLSTWFRDYVYIPLGGSRVSKLIWVRNLMIVFLISGFWHGANWTFVSWGIMHGILTIITVILFPTIKGQSNKIRQFTAILLNFFIVTLIWIFFRAISFEQAFVIMNKYVNAIPVFINDIISKPHFLWLEALTFNIDLATNGFDLLLAFIGIIMLFGVEWLFISQKWVIKFNLLPLTIKASAYCFLILFTLTAGMFHSNQEFIYFQF